MKIWWLCYVIYDYLTMNYVYFLHNFVSLRPKTQKTNNYERFLVSSVPGYTSVGRCTRQQGLRQKGRVCIAYHHG